MFRILLIGLKNYAYDSRTQRHAGALEERGDEVDVICLGNHKPEGSKVNLLGLTTGRYRGRRRTSYLVSYVRLLVLATYRVLRCSVAERYDLVIVSSMPDATILCALPARLFGSVIILDVRDTMPELYRDKFGVGWRDLGARLLMAEERVCAWLADRVFAVHEPHRRRLEQAGIPAEKIAVITNGSDPRIFSPRATLPGSSMDSFTLVYHGGLVHRLGLDVVLRAVDILRDRIPRLRVMILGSGDADYIDILKSMAATMNINDRIEWLHRVPVWSLPDVLARADIGLVPNRSSDATNLMLPVKLLEYAALNIPVISARLHTVAHYFDDDAVRYFTPGDAEDLSEAIEELYRSPVRRNRLAINAARIAETLNWSNQKKEFHRVVDELLRSRETASRHVTNET